MLTVSHWTWAPHAQLKKHSSLTLFYICLYSSAVGSFLTKMCNSCIIGRYSYMFDVQHVRQLTVILEKPMQNDDLTAGHLHTQVWMYLK